MQQIVRGRGRLNGTQLKELLTALNMKQPMLVCSREMASLFEKRAGMPLVTFSAFHPNPDLSDCEAGASMFNALGCDGLISFGGGSAMDTAKGVKAMLTAPDLESVRASRLKDERLPHIAIPGTAGTGAEATPIAVVYVKNQKLSLDHPALLPDAVVLDSSLLDTLPPYHRKSCAMDALCQGIESYWAVNATQESRVHAARAVQGVTGSLRAYLEGDPRAQDAMMEAAYESGCAIRISRTTAAHAMSYQITKKLGPAHGHACMLTLPHLWARLWHTECRSKLAELAELMNLPRADQGPEYLLGMLSALEMDSRALPEDDVLDALAASVNAQRLGNHPEQLDQQTLREIYAAALNPMQEETRARLAAFWRKHAK